MARGPGSAGAGRGPRAAAAAALPRRLAHGSPDYVGLGVQKAGTSWWDALIGRHPSIVRARGLPKELHFFDAAWEEPFGEADVARYQRYFPRPDGCLAGEWTPGYLIDFWTPGLLAVAAPRPGSSSCSGTPWSASAPGSATSWRHRGRPLADRDIQGAFQRGLYAPQLRRVLAAFPADQVFIGQYEACRADPASELARTYAFLGLAPFEPDAAELRGRGQPSTGPRFEPAPSLRPRPRRGLRRRPRAARGPRARAGPLPVADALARLGLA